jgi:hypothetical protein
VSRERDGLVSHTVRPEVEDARRPKVPVLRPRLLDRLAIQHLNERLGLESASHHVAGLRDDDKPVVGCHFDDGRAGPSKVLRDGRQHPLGHYGPGTPALLCNLVSKRQDVLTRRTAATWRMDGA